MKHTRNLLLYELWTSIIISAIIILLYETDIINPGTIVARSNTEFVCVTTMEILTICLLPLSLRMFKINNIQKRLKEGGVHALAKWGSIRMLMICIPLIANTLMYFMSMNVSFGYMAIIFFICLLFVYPNMGRCVAETGGEA